jgi:hypothetical protein
MSTDYLDEDSFLDIIAANRDNATIGIFYGLGNGAFRSQKLYSTITGVAYVAVKDMNNDNKIDISLTYTLLNTID